MPTLGRRAFLAGMAAVFGAPHAAAGRGDTRPTRVGFQTETLTFPPSAVTTQQKIDWLSTQVDEIAQLSRDAAAKLLIVDSALTPVQQKNLEEEVGTKVIDRTGLILEIFGERAATAEGRLQVELAHLDYQAGRLVRSWTHLERQRGGFGFLGGPGET